MIRYNLCFFGMLFPAIAALCQNYDAQAVAQAFLNEGFENIRTTALSEDRTLIATYNNRHYRWSNGAIRSASLILSAYSSQYQKLVLIPQDHTVPQYAIQLGRTDFLQDHRISYSIGPEWQALQSAQRINPSDFKFEIILYPQIYIQNTTFDKIYETQINLAPELSLLLSQGIRISGQMIFPLHNDLEYAGNFIRPGIITFSHFARLPQSVFSFLYAGNFTNNRYGIDLRLRREFDSWPIGLVANVGFTGISSFIKHTWYYSRINTWTWKLRGYTWYMPMNMLLGIDYTRYLEQDQGIRIDCTRFWGETAVGFFAVHTSAGFNGGFHFSLALSGELITRMTFLNVRLPNYFDWQYNGKANGQIGQMYETVPDANYTEMFLSKHYQRKIY